LVSKGFKSAIRKRNADVQLQLGYKIAKKTVEYLRDNMMLENIQRCLPAYVFVDLAMSFLQIKII